MNAREYAIMNFRRMSSSLSVGSVTGYSFDHRNFIFAHDLRKKMCMHVPSIYANEMSSQYNLHF